MASMVRILLSMSKKRPLDKVLVLISQQGPEILSSLCFAMLCPYLRGHSTYECYFFHKVSAFTLAFQYLMPVMLKMPV